MKIRVDVSLTNLEYIYLIKNHTDVDVKVTLSDDGVIGKQFVSVLSRPAKDRDNEIIPQDKVL